MVISGGRATLFELQTIYGVQDLYDLLEIVAIDANNAQAVARHKGS